MDSAKKFDMDKYKDVLEYVSNKIKIKNFNLTGGEPTLNYDKFKKVFDMSNDILDKKVNITINTNGINLDRIVDDEDIIERVDSISLSRHHYIDKKNNDIFETDIISNKEIKKIQKKIKNKDILNFTCNLIKGQIDNKYDVYKYLDVASNLGIKQVGFVSLMPINDYCDDSFVNFNRLGLKSELFTMTKEFKYKNICRCNNYVYISEESGNMVRVYYKNTYSPDDVDILIYDGQNLSNGFNSDIIY